ncbi:MAG: glycine-rich domain-containing protein [Ferruginibacter sp.]
MKIKLISMLLFIVAPFFASAQNVGIGNNSPSEKLDVNGNINVAGTIKANGVDGTANQVLMKNSSGVLAWGDMCDYKNAVTFTNIGSSTWPVPAGVTKVRVEVWGGGGGATGNGSGAGGGYVTGIFDVSGGSVSYTVGAGGANGSPTASSGASSQASYATFIINGLGGEGDISATSGNVAAGGLFSGNSASGFYGEVGEAGAQNRFEGYQLNSTTYRENQTGGKGGNGGHSENTGGKGAYLLRDGATSSVIYGYSGGHGRMPGGGGGGSLTWGGAVKNGGQGMVIIHY